MSNNLCELVCGQAIPRHSVSVLFQKQVDIWNTHFITKWYFVDPGLQDLIILDSSQTSLISHDTFYVYIESWRQSADARNRSGDRELEPSSQLHPLAGGRRHSHGRNSIRSRIQLPPVRLRHLHRGTAWRVPSRIVIWVDFCPWTTDIDELTSNNMCLDGKVGYLTRRWNRN